MKYVVTILVLFVFVEFCKAEDKSIKGVRNFKSLVFISSGMPFSSGSPAFFKVYRDEFKGYANDFKFTPYIGAGTKLRFGQYRVGAQFYILNSILQDSYSENLQTGGISGYREYAQTLDVTDIPIILSFEYMPYLMQFRTYFGGGVGFMMRHTNWLEAIRSNIALDRRVGGDIYEETDLFPFIKLYSGVELGFDKKSEDTFLGSLIIEASYNYSSGGADVFSKVRRQFVPQPEILNNSVNLLPGYFVLSLGLTFNFNKQNTNLKQ